MPNKEMNRAQLVEVKVTAPAASHGAASKPATTTAKAVVSKPVKECAMSPGAPAPAAASVDAERTELLGSLTTQQQQRTSARVIKKLRLEPPASDKRPAKKDGVDEAQECEAGGKGEEKEAKCPLVKQRMPKALWSADEKSLFFEALNEYGKDFDAVTAHIRAKMKKKGMPDNQKTKTQVSHFYYRTWHKLSKHVHFDENVKKVAQELYALINYGELRKKLVSVSEKTCARLGEMVLCGSIVVRARGRNLRVRTPMCRALRCLNQITELSCGARVCSRAAVGLRARTAAAWARVQGAAHNPRALLSLPLRTRLRALLRALDQRWAGGCKQDPLSFTAEEGAKEEGEEVPTEPEPRTELDDQLHLQTDRIILQDRGRRLALHVGPRAGAELQLPEVRASEPLSSHKICFSSYLERMGALPDKRAGAKLRAAKRTRKDSAADREREAGPSKRRAEEPVAHLEESAIDGIELMASYRSREEEDKPSTEDETADPDHDRDLPERDKELLDKEMSEREKDSFSEMEDDEKYNKSDTDNESDHGKEKHGKDGKFHNLKVKFRIRPKKRGGSIYTLVAEHPEEAKAEEACAKEAEAKADVDVELAMRQVRKGWSQADAGELTIGDLYLMFGSRSKLELDYWWAEPTPPLPQPADRRTDRPTEPDKKPDKLSEPDKRADSSAEDERDKNRESDSDMLSPKYHSQDSNDGLSGDERKSEQVASPDYKSSSGSLNLAQKLINRPLAPPADNGFAQMSDRLRRLLALAGHPLLRAPPARCACAPAAAPRAPAPRAPGAVFRAPPPIAPRPDDDAGSRGAEGVEGVPAWRRGRPRGPSRQVVVQRLLPLLPKHSAMPVKKVVPKSPPALPRLLPKPPPAASSDLSFFYVLSESNGQFYFHDGERRIPITPLTAATDGEEMGEESESNGIKSEPSSHNTDCTEQKYEPGVEPAPDATTAPAGDATEPSTEPKTEGEANEMAPEFLPTESMSLSPSRLLHSGGWLEGDVPDFSLSSFLGHLDGRVQPDLAVDSQLQSLMAESSVDYVAKFADLAAEVTDGQDLPADELN